jgi:hypothetical protein
MHKLKEILLKYSGQDWKTLAFPVLLIYWVIIITATFSLVFDACLKVPKLYEGSCIRDLVARGLKLKPKESGFKDIEKFLSLLGA